MIDEARELCGVWTTERHRSLSPVTVELQDPLRGRGFPQSRPKIKLISPVRNVRLREYH